MGSSACENQAGDVLTRDPGSHRVSHANDSSLTDVILDKFQKSKGMWQAGIEGHGKRSSLGSGERPFRGCEVGAGTKIKRGAGESESRGPSPHPEGNLRTAGEEKQRMAKKRAGWCCDSPGQLLIAT